MKIIRNAMLLMQNDHSYAVGLATGKSWSQINCYCS